jgi:4-diphosphocytidyl-2C-methyl-D-erythritol kinase
VPEDFVNWLSDSGNDFEPIQTAAFEQLQKIKNDLVDNGALLTRMSGSGPTVFGIYRSAPDITGDRVLGSSDWTTAVVRPIRLPAPL